MLLYWLYGIAILAGLLFLRWLPRQLDYRITNQHLEVTFFGLPIRRVKLANIVHVSKRHSIWAENWWNTWRPFRRRILVRRRKGLIKNFVITPKYRYRFKAELERALANLGKTLPPSEPAPPEEEGPLE